MTAPALPRSARPIVAIGAGAIVRDAHWPAYRLAGFPVHSVYDLNTARAEELARACGVSKVARSLAEAIDTAPPRAVFDLALPAAAVASFDSPPSSSFITGSLSLYIWDHRTRPWRIAHLASVGSGLMGLLSRALTSASSHACSDGSSCVDSALR